MKKTATKKKAAKKKPGKKTAKKVAPKPAANPFPVTNTISPYLTFNGNCEDAFGLYRAVFGGDFQYVGRFKDMPPIEGKSVPESEMNKIMHISLPISRETVLMGSDSSDAFGRATVQGTNFSISVNATSNNEADRIFNGLSDGGQVTMPMNKTFWGSYFGMLTDRYGIQWMVSHEDTKSKP